jgi:hypothetical protein
MLHLISRNVLSAAVQNSKNWCQPILLYPELYKLGCPGRAIRVAVVRSRTRPNARGAEAAAEKVDKN